MKSASKHTLLFLLCLALPLANGSNCKAAEVAVELNGHTAADAVSSVAFSPDGKKIVTTGHDETIRIWDTETGQELKKWENKSAVGFVLFSPNGKQIVTTGTIVPVQGELKVFSPGEFVQIYEADSGKELHLLQYGEGIRSVAFSPDGKKLVTIDGEVRIWDAESGEELQKIEAMVYSVAFSPDGKKLVAGIFAAGADFAQIWDVETGQVLQKLEGHPRPVERAVFSPDGTKVATASRDETTRIWDAKSGKELHKLEGGGLVAFSPDGTILVTTDNVQRPPLRIWDTESGRELRKIEGHTVGIWTVAFLPNSKKMITSSADRTVRVWDADSGKELQTVQNLGEDEQVGFHSSRAFVSPDGKKVAIIALDVKQDGIMYHHPVRVWNLQ